MPGTLEAQNTQVVQAAYAAFSRGDIDGVLATMSPEIHWRPVTGAGPHVPFAGERRGKPAVGEFFKTLAAVQEFETFEPREFIAQGDKVVAIGHYVGKVKAGGRFESDFVMVFTLRDGKVTAFQEFTDCAGVNAAFEQAK